MFRSTGKLTIYFYPRPPRGGRHRIRKIVIQFDYFYPRPPRGGRPDHFRDAETRIQISIHALREEGDPERGCPGRRAGISIHALREEGDVPW